MDLIKTEVKESPGLCRCCHSEGCYKDLTAEYLWMSETEVYADMLLQCFNISLSQQPEGPDGATNLICEVCITRLRDASHFKKQVQDSERTFVNMMLVRGEMHKKVVSYETDPLIKQEAVKKEDPEDLQEAAREDLKLSDEDDGVSCCDVSRDASPHALGAECDSSRVLGCRVEVRDELLCSQSGERSLTAARLQRHRQTHATRVQPTHGCQPTHTQHTSKIFVCDICDKTFARKDSLKYHLLVHSGVKRYSCETCNKSFNQSSSLKRHMISHTKIKPFACDMCDKTFKQKTHLKSHKIIHSGVREYSCEICSKSFNRSDTLKSHLLSHGKLKSFMCDICDKTFINKGNLKKHIVVHSAAKRYYCEICSRSYNRSSNLKTHIRTHSQLDPFTCFICDKTFIRKDLLKNHVLVHSGSKPYSCEICSKSFNRISNLKRHSRIHSRP